MSDSPASEGGPNTDDLVTVNDPAIPTAGALRAAGYTIDPSIPNNAVAFDVNADTPAVNS